MPVNKYKEYLKWVQELLYWNFINVEEVEQRHIDAYLKRLGIGE